MRKTHLLLFVFILQSALIIFLIARSIGSSEYEFSCSSAEYRVKVPMTGAPVSLTDSAPPVVTASASQILPVPGFRPAKLEQWLADEGPRFQFAFESSQANKIQCWLEPALR